MKIEVLDNVAAVAERAATIIAEAAREAAAPRGRFGFAVSGGRTPWVMLALLADKQVPWASVHVFQVDERVAPSSDPDRNLTHLEASFLAHAPLQREQVHPMPVEISDLATAAESYSATLQEFCGTPPALDLVHLGLGPDGHTVCPTIPSGSLRQRYRRISGPSTNDAQVPGARPCPSGPLGRHGRGQGRGACQAFIGRPLNSRWARPPGRRLRDRGSRGGLSGQGG